MNSDESQAIPGDELRVVEELTELRFRVGELREQLGDRTHPAGDLADMASVPTSVERQDGGKWSWVCCGSIGAAGDMERP